MYGLRDYQEEAVGKLRSGSILCGGVGSGKSRTSLAYFVVKVCGDYVGDSFDELKSPKPLYIITTAKKRDSLEWEGELVVFHICKDHSPVPVVIDSWNNVSKYQEISDAFFIFDEQRVVGSGSWAKSFIKIAKHNEWIMLTATPGDTWMDYISVFIANGFYRNRSEFLYKHAIFDRFVSRYPKIKGWAHEKELEALRDSITVKMDFERKRSVVESCIYSEYDTAKYMKAFRDRINPYTGEPINDASALCYILRRIVNSDQSRLDNALDVCLRHPRVIVFYNFDYELELLRSMCYENKIPYSEYNGHKHEPIIDGDQWVYLVQYTAGAEGWNCTETDTIMFYSQNYSYKIMKQASGRIDRLNTSFDELLYYHLLSNSTIDLNIRAAIRKKRNFNENAFVEGNLNYRIL